MWILVEISGSLVFEDIRLEAFGEVNIKRYEGLMEIFR